jgi:hypothetical protein
MQQEPAGILLGHSPDQGTKGIPFIREITGRDRVEALTAQGIKALTAQGVDAKIYREIKPDLIARLYAKIALGFAVVGPGLEGFESRVLDVILRRDTTLSIGWAEQRRIWTHFPGQRDRWCYTE